MKFLLVAINAKYIHSNPAIYSLYAYAGVRLQPYIELAEYTINRQMQDILEDICLRRPDVIGFSCYIWNWTMVQELLREIPKILPGADIWLGGPEAGYQGSGLLREFPQVKGIMAGEGEASFKELLEWYVFRHEEGAACAADIHDIPGLCLDTGRTAVREPVDLNDLPFFYGDSLCGSRELFANRIIYYETSRGCPFRCSYCLSSVEKSLRFRDINVVKKELQYFLDNSVKQVKFVDRTFNCNHEHAMEIWRYIHENDNGVTNFHFEISADILQAEEIELLSRLRPGLAQLEIGVQSANPEALRAVNRTADLDRLERNVAAIHKGHNIHLHLDLIAGLPYEDYESFGHSFNRVYAMRPEQLQLGFLKVLKGSRMAEQAEEFGIRYLSAPPYEVLYTRWLSYEDVRRLKRIEEMVELYYNSNQFTHTLAFLEQAFKEPFAMYEALADFYGRRGYYVQSPARIYRYQVLLDFAMQYDGEYEGIYRELLTYDMYLRENLKSRPDFAGEMRDSTRQAVREFYRTEERTRKYLPTYTEFDWKQLSKMTHLEPFLYPVWDEKLLQACRSAASAKKNEEPAAYVLFDYKNRNPLTYEARTVCI